MKYAISQNVYVISTFHRKTIFFILPRILGIQPLQSAFTSKEFNSSNYYYLINIVYVRVCFIHCEKM